jgi:uncharacterized protein
LEEYIYSELSAYLSYRKDGRKLSFWRTTAGIEVDFIIGTDTAIEVKASSNITEKHCKALRLFSEETNCKHQVIVCMANAVRKVGNIEVLPVRQFLEKLWNDVYTA